MPKNKLIEFTYEGDPMFIIAVYMFDYQLNEFRKTYVYEISKKKVKFTKRSAAKNYKSELQANKDIKLLDEFNSTYCKTLNVVIERK